MVIIRVPYLKHKKYEILQQIIATPTAFVSPCQIQCFRRTIGKCSKVSGFITEYIPIQGISMYQIFGI